MMLMSALVAELEARERWLRCTGTSRRARSIGRRTASGWPTTRGRSCPGSLFACLRGASFDGHDHAGRAVAAGAVALLVDHELADVGHVPQLVVDDTRLAARTGRRRSCTAIRAATLTTVGITGTNGKTTTAQLRRRPSRPRVEDRDRRHAARRRARRRRRRSCSRRSPSFRDGGLRRPCSRCRRTRSRCIGSTAPSSTRWCSPTSAGTTSTCTVRPRSTSGPRPGCSSASFAPLADGQHRRSRTAGCSPT